MGAVKINGQTSGSTTITAPATGGDETIELSTALAGKLPIAGGKILQIVRATDSTLRSTTSTSLVDVTGMSVTITPQKSDSAILIIPIASTDGVNATNEDIRRGFAVTDNSNNLIGGEYLIGTNNITGTGTRESNHPIFFIAYATPATTSAVTYKLRFRSLNASTTNRVRNDGPPGQMYAIEVSA